MMRRLLPIALVVLVSVSPVDAQWTNVPPPTVPRTPDGRPNLSAPTPRLPDGKPDLSGLWNPPAGAVANLARGLEGDVPFQPWAKALYDERMSGVHWKDDPPASCLPQGLPRLLLAPAPWRILQTPTVVLFVHEAFNLWWQAFVDGRRFAPHPDVAPTWHGYSTAAWDGDTLAIDSRGFNGKLWLDQLGKPSTEALHVTTRFSRRNFGRMDLQITIDDPKAYTRPWTVSAGADLLIGSELMEFICLENERDARKK